MRKSIALIELYQHEEVLRHYCDLLKDSNYTINIYCSTFVAEAMSSYPEKERFEWVAKKEDSSIEDFFAAYIDEIKQHSITIICTALNSFKAFDQLVSQTKALLIVHNVHSFIAPDEHISLSSQFPIKDRLRLLKAYGTRAHHYKREILEKVSGLIFPSQTILNYTKDNFSLPKNLLLMNLPFAYYQSKARQLSATIKITIPCSVNSDLRDYEPIISTFESIKKGLTQNLQLVLLGQPVNDAGHIITAFQNLANDKLEVITFDQHIPSQVYESHLQSTHLLILPLKQNLRNHIYLEKMGYSKISGGINDMIRWGIPTMLPDYFPVEEDWATIVQSYAPETLTVQLKKWLEKKEQIASTGLNQTLLDSRSKTQMQKDFIQQIEKALTVS